MKCPKCKNVMNKIQYQEEIFYYQCNKCGYSIGKPVIEEPIEEVKEPIIEESKGDQSDESIKD